RRVAARTHPDLYVLEPLGEMIRIDDVRALRRDLHMRPFEAPRRVYVVLGAERLNEDAADALLKDLEEPPPYAVLVLVASELRPRPADDPLTLPARSLPTALGAGGPRVDCCARTGSLGGRSAGARAGRRRTSRPRPAAPRSRRCGPPRRRHCGCPRAIPRSC